MAQWTRPFPAASIHTPKRTPRESQGPGIESPHPHTPPNKLFHRKIPPNPPRIPDQKGQRGGLTLDDFVGSLDGIGLEDPLGRPRLGHGRAAAAAARWGGAARR